MDKNAKNAKKLKFKEGSFEESLADGCVLLVDDTAQTVVEIFEHTEVVVTARYMLSRDEGCSEVSCSGSTREEALRGVHRALRVV